MLLDSFKYNLTCSKFCQQIKEATYIWYEILMNINLIFLNVHND